MKIEQWDIGQSDQVHEHEDERARVSEYYGRVLAGTEDTATYRGTIPENPHRFDLDDHHAFVTGKPMLVCGNTASMLAETRYARHFTVTGDRAVHFGAFDCKPARGDATDRNGGSECC